LSADPERRVLSLQAGGWDWHPYIHVSGLLPRACQLPRIVWDYGADLETDQGGVPLSWMAGRVMGLGVRVTHPFHPLAGRLLELVKRRRYWGADLLVVLDDAGEVLSLPAAWTDAVAADPFVVVSAGLLPVPPSRSVGAVGPDRFLGSPAAVCHGDYAVSVEWITPFVRGCGNWLWRIIQGISGVAAPIWQVSRTGIAVSDDDVLGSDEGFFEHAA
jgi:hypothetical protein